LKESTTMPFLHKLSKRVARIRSRTLMVAAGAAFACEPSDRSSGRTVWCRTSAPWVATTQRPWQSTTAARWSARAKLRQVRITPSCGATARAEISSESL